MKPYDCICAEVIKEVLEVLRKIEARKIQDFINFINNADKIFFIGVGRVLLSLESMTKRLKHLGYDTHVVGDINEPPINSNDILIVGSGSGESIIPLEISKKAKELKAKVILLTSSEESSISRICDYKIVFECPNKKDNYQNVKSIQLMSTLFEQSLFLFGDIVSLMIMEKNEIDVLTVIYNHANLE